MKAKFGPEWFPDDLTSIKPLDFGGLFVIVPVNEVRLWMVIFLCLPSGKLTWQRENGPVEDVFPY